MIYEVGAHSPGTLRIWDAFMHLLVPCSLYLFRSKSFVLLAQLSNLLRWAYRLSSAALCHC
jgi:hypothetical protein